jgi:hypothetical protein
MTTNIFPSTTQNVIHTIRKTNDNDDNDNDNDNDNNDNDNNELSSDEMLVESILQSSSESEIDPYKDPDNNKNDIYINILDNKKKHSNDTLHEHDNINSKSILDILEQNEHSSTTLIKKNKNGLYSLNTYDEVFFKKYKDRLVRKKEVYIVSSELFQKKALCLTIPSILITCIMSIISFFSASTYFTENTRIIMGLLVGSLGSLGTLFQTFQSALNYNTKAEAFRNAAEKYDTLITKIKFELYNHNENDFIDKLEKEVLKISSTCKYFPPQSVKNLIIFNDKYINKVTNLFEKYEDGHSVSKEPTHKRVRNINNMTISIDS